MGYHHLVNKIPLETKTTLLGLGFYYTEKHFLTASKRLALAVLQVAVIVVVVVVVVVTL